MPEVHAVHLFLYGTLMRGECRHQAMAGCEFLREAMTTPHYHLRRLPSYPGLIPAEQNGTSILGEVWRVPRGLLERLDRIEGVDEGLYARRDVELTVSEFDPVQSYFYLGETSPGQDCGDRWR